MVKCTVPHCCYRARCLTGNRATCSMQASLSVAMRTGNSAFGKRVKPAQSEWQLREHASTGCGHEDWYAFRGRIEGLDEPMRWARMTNTKEDPKGEAVDRIFQPTVRGSTRPATLGERSQLPLPSPSSHRAGSTPRNRGATRPRVTTWPGTRRSRLEKVPTSTGPSKDARRRGSTAARMDGLRWQF
jgi:hypothetical protein